jgi:hypothetical protein
VPSPELAKVSLLMQVILVATRLAPRFQSVAAFGYNAQGGMDDARTDHVLALLQTLCLPARQLLISDDVRIDFFALFALTESEMNLKLNQGLNALVKSLADAEVFTELLDPGRRSAV